MRDRRGGGVVSGGGGVRREERGGGGGLGGGRGGGVWGGGGLGGEERGGGRVLGGKKNRTVQVRTLNYPPPSSSVSSHHICQRSAHSVAVAATGAALALASPLSLPTLSFG